MKNTLKIGPILGLESESLYTICFLTEKEVNKVSVNIDGNIVDSLKIKETPSGLFWRAECQLVISQSSRSIDYTVNIDGKPSRDKNQRSSWTFFVPSKEDTPKFAYTSCNGFSSDALREKTSDPYYLWKKMATQHAESPFSLMFMGGDQLYADSIWAKGSVSKLYEWSELPRKEKIKRKATKVMKEQIDRFYDRLYCERWSNAEMSLMLASIPSVMMWDDHDIIDGWGSYPVDIQTCDVYKSIFKSAKKYFELFQIRSIKNQSLINSNSTHYAFVLSFRGYQIVAIDNRSERTLENVMSKEQWIDFNSTLSNLSPDGDLLLLTAVPVVYRDFSFTEGVFEATPWEEELTDDLKDHWRAKEHQGERARLIMNLLDDAKQRNGRTVILSGDIHIGCLGVINDKRGVKPVKIHQVVSSGIVHPSPSMIEWFGIMAVTNDRHEHLNEDESIKISMIKPHGSDKYIRSRNFVTLEKGTDDKLWINWVCEQDDKPAYPLES